MDQQVVSSAEAVPQGAGVIAIEVGHDLLRIRPV